MITISSTEHNLKVNNYLYKLGQENQKSMNRLATGYRLESAEDNAGSYQTAVDATVELRGLEVANQNATTAQKITAAADESLTQIIEIAHTIKSLAQSAYRGTADERQALQDEANELMEQMESLKESTEYNDVAVFRDGGFTFQVGYKGNSDSTLSVNTSLEADQLSGFDIKNYKVDFTTGATEADVLATIENEMTTFDTLQDDLNIKQSEVGSKNSILGNIIYSQEQTYTNVNTTRGELINTDVAYELYNYVRTDILYDVTSSLKQQTAKLDSSVVLGLIV